MSLEEYAKGPAIQAVLACFKERVEELRLTVELPSWEKSEAAGSQMGFTSDFPLDDGEQTFYAYLGRAIKQAAEVAAKLAVQHNGQVIFTTQYRRNDNNFVSSAYYVWNVEWSAYLPPQHPGPEDHDDGDWWKK